jgi:DNA polymerase-3 subunit delta
MRITTDRLARTLDQSPANAWLIAGGEPLLVGEAADAIRARARAAGFSGRELFTTDRSFDWRELLASCQSLSLFSERRIIEVRMPSPRPGKEGGAILARLAADPPPDTLLLVMTTRPEGETYATAWFKSFEKHGHVVLAWPVEIGRLPRWITERATRHGLVLETEAAALLAERVEGNLLAAHQEIEKLALLHPHSRLTVEDVQAAVSNSARYDVFQLGEAALEGDAARSLASSMDCARRAPRRRSCCGSFAASCAGSPNRGRIPARRRDTGRRRSGDGRCCAARSPVPLACRWNRCSCRRRSPTGRSRARAAAMRGRR